MAFLLIRTSSPDPIPLHTSSKQSLTHASIAQQNKSTDFLLRFTNLNYAHPDLVTRERIERRFSQ